MEQGLAVWWQGWGVLAAIALGVTSCMPTPPSGPPAASVTSAVPAVSPIPSSIPSLAPSPISSPGLKGTPSTAASPAGGPVSPRRMREQPMSTPMTTVFIYKADRQCLNVVSEKVVLPRHDALVGAIARILETWDNADFDLAGYRVAVASGVATVDLRVAPGSKRQLASLSSCEQLGLLGSIRKTLTANSQWQIQEVEFTQHGKAL